MMVIGLLVLTSCAAPESEPQPQAPPAEQDRPAPAPVERPAPASVTAGQTEFGVELYRRVAADPGNIFLSPAGISMALGMVHSGAEGETAAEMASALRYPAAGAREGMADLLARLPIAAEGRRLDVANALWVQQSFPLKPDFLEQVRRDYGGGAEAVDFVGAPDRAIARVNRWAEEKTAGR